jgi:L-2-hydroxyglutarate oxidase
MGRTHSIRARRIGKLIIATEEHEVPALERLYEATHANGMLDLHLMRSARQVKNLEPSVEAIPTIYSGSSGVIDQMELTRSFLNVAQGNGALVAFKHTVTSLERCNGGFVLTIDDPTGESSQLKVSVLAKTRTVNFVRE